MIDIKGKKMTYEFKPQDLIDAIMDIDTMIKSIEGKREDEKGAGRVLKALTTAYEVLLVFTTEHTKKN